MIAAVSEGISGEAGLLGLSILQGMLLMMAYDAVRIFRRLFQHGAISMAVEDFVYWSSCSIAIFAMIYQKNDGLIRWFALAGIGLGMLTENHFFSPWVVKIFVAVFLFIRKIRQKIWGVFRIPLGFGKRRIDRILRKCKKQLKKLGKAVKIGLSKR